MGEESNMFATEGEDSSSVASGSGFDKGGHDLGDNISVTQGNGDDKDEEGVQDDDEQDVWTVTTGIATPMVGPKLPVSLAAIAFDVQNLPCHNPEDTPEPHRSKGPPCGANANDFELHSIYLNDISDDASENAILDYFEGVDARKKDDQDPLERMEEATVGTQDDSLPPSVIAPPIGFKDHFYDGWFRKLPKWLRVTIFVYACVLVVGVTFATTVLVLSYTDSNDSSSTSMTTSHPPEDAVIPGPVMLPSTNKPCPSQQGTPAPAVTINLQTVVPIVRDEATAGPAVESAVPAVCQDSSDGLFAVTDEATPRTASCQWLSTQIAYRLMMCQPGFDAYDLCLATCGRCPT